MRKLPYFMILLGALLLPVIAQADPVIINDAEAGADSYWGQTPNGYGDILGSPYFDVSKMEITINGNLWTVALYGNYFANHWTNNYYGLPAAYGPGDLYINSEGWMVDGVNPGSPGHHTTDTFSTSEGWDYVVTYTEKDGWGLYSLNGADIQYTQCASGTCRQGTQAWMDGAGEFRTAATYDYYQGDDHLTYIIDMSPLNLQEGDPVGLHWTMKCGNDVVEGLVATPPRGDTVPEPSTLILLGLGLAGIGAYRKFKS